MNHWQNEHMNEYLIKYHWQDLLLEAQQARLAKQLLEYQSGLYGKAMFNFANWMIFTGRNLRKKYETPPISCGQYPTNTFAR